MTVVLKIIVKTMTMTMMAMTTYMCRYEYKDGEGGGRDTYLADNNITTYLIEGRVEVMKLMMMMLVMTIFMI